MFKIVASLPARRVEQASRQLSKMVCHSQGSSGSPSYLKKERRKSVVFFFKVLTTQNRFNCIAIFQNQYFWLFDSYLNLFPYYLNYLEINNDTLLFDYISIIWKFIIW